MLTVAGSRVRLLLADGEPVVRLGLAALFGAELDLAVVAQAASAGEAAFLSSRHRPDVVVLEAHLPGGGTEACRTIHSTLPGVRLVVLTADACPDAVADALAAGASAYLLKTIAPERLLEAVRLVAAGGAVLDPGVTGGVLDQVRRGAHRGAADDPLASLSEQERRVLPLIAEGRTNREIGAALCVSEHTVKSYVSALLRKLGLARRARAAAYQAHRRSGGETRRAVVATTRSGVPRYPFGDPDRLRTAGRQPRSRTPE